MFKIFLSERKSQSDDNLNRRARDARLLVEVNLRISEENASTAAVLSQYESCFRKIMSDSMKVNRSKVSYVSYLATVELQMKKCTRRASKGKDLRPSTLMYDVDNEDDILESGVRMVPYWP